MSEWVFLAVVALIVIYKLADKWLDSRGEPEGEHRATYSTHERADSEDGYEDGYEDRARIGFTKE